MRPPQSQARLTYYTHYTHANGRRHVYMLKNPFRQLTNRKEATDRKEKEKTNREANETNNPIK